MTDQIRDMITYAGANNKKLYIAYDPSYTRNADDFARKLSMEFDTSLFGMLPVFP